jgi:hypothetical protein
VFCVYEVFLTTHQVIIICSKTKIKHSAIKEKYRCTGLAFNMDPDSSIYQEDQNEESSLWDSPVKAGKDKPRSTYEQQEAREQELRREVESVRRVNEAIEGVIESLGKAKDNIKVA